MRIARHGTTNEYANFKCRCALCRAAWAKEIAAYRASKKARGLCRSCTEPVENGYTRCLKHRQLRAEPHRRAYQPHPRQPRTPRHGTVTEYANYGCRCKPCYSAWAAKYVARKASGLCASCAQPVVEGRSRCAEHLRRCAEWQRGYVRTR